MTSLIYPSPRLFARFTNPLNVGRCAVDIFAYEPGDDPFDVSFVDCVFKNNGKWAIWQVRDNGMGSSLRRWWTPHTHHTHGHTQNFAFVSSLVLTYHATQHLAYSPFTITLWYLQENSENIFSVVRCTFENNDDNDVEAYGPFTCLSSCPGKDSQHPLKQVSDTSAHIYNCILIFLLPLAVTAPPNQCDCAFTAAPTPAPTPSTDVSYVAAQGEP